MNSNINRFIEQLFLNLFRENALTANLAKRLV
jgi:hypothetical protein